MKRRHKILDDGLVPVYIDKGCKTHTSQHHDGSQISGTSDTKAVSSVLPLVGNVEIRRTDSTTSLTNTSTNSVKLRSTSSYSLGMSGGAKSGNLGWGGNDDKDGTSRLGEMLTMDNGRVRHEDFVPGREASDTLQTVVPESRVSYINSVQCDTLPVSGTRVLVVETKTRSVEYQQRSVKHVELSMFRPLTEPLHTGDIRTHMPFENKIPSEHKMSPEHVMHNRQRSNSAVEFAMRRRYLSKPANISIPLNPLHHHQSNSLPQQQLNMLHQNLSSGLRSTGGCSEMEKWSEIPLNEPGKSVSPKPPSSSRPNSATLFSSSASPRTRTELSHSEMELPTATLTMETDSTFPIDRYAFVTMHMDARSGNEAVRKHVLSCAGKSCVYVSEEINKWLEMHNTTQHSAFHSNSQVRGVAIEGDTGRGIIDSLNILNQNTWVLRFMVCTHREIVCTGRQCDEPEVYELRVNTRNFGTNGSYNVVFGIAYHIEMHVQKLAVFSVLDTPFVKVDYTASPSVCDMYVFGTQTKSCVVLPKCTAFDKAMLAKCYCNVYMNFVLSERKLLDAIVDAQHRKIAAQPQTWLGRLKDWFEKWNNKQLNMEIKNVHLK